MKKSAPLVAVAFVSLVVILSCTTRETPVEKGNREQILHFGNGSEPQDLDPHIVTGVPEHNIIVALLEGLVAEHPEDLSPVPGAAARWEQSEDGLTYTFFLQQDGTWTNGDPVTAQDFVYSFRRMLTPSLAGEYAYMLYCMKNAEKYHKGDITDFADVGVAAIDDTTLTIELAKPTPYFLSLMTHYSWFPVHRPTIEKYGKIDQRGSKWTRPEHYVGNGPFILKEWKLNEIVIVEKSPTYWDNKTVKLNQIRFYPIESAQTEERAFRSGQLHVTGTVPLNKIEVYQREQPELLSIDPYLGTYYYLVNVTEKPLDDPRVRRALAMSIDRTSIVDNVLKGGQLPAFHFTPPNTNGYKAQAKSAYDVDKAKELLAQAGYPNGEGFPEVEVLYNTSEAHQILAQAIQQMWNKNLNITVSLINQEWKVYLETQKKKEYDISRAGWIGDYNDPNTFLDLWVTGGGNNRTGFSNGMYDSLIDAASKEQDRQTRYGYFQEAEKILMEEMPVIPIYFYTSLSLIQPGVKGYYPTILDHHPYKHVYLAHEMHEKTRKKNQKQKTSSKQKG
ncbi:MAG: peptide ABC transporter substrate-binding protein [Chitinivibrionales bacterium]|nr:peptide ABC transporter substrate-binding protein [Chitinivibrionales bacterium]